MKQSILAQVQFERLWEIVLLLCPHSESISVFTSAGDLVWHSQPQPPRALELLQAYISDDPTDDTGMVRLSVDQSQQLAVSRSHDDATDTPGPISAVLAQATGHDDPLEPALQWLNRQLLHEHHLLETIATNEQELDYIAEELGQRYEELNLVYSADEHAHNLSHGRELLKIMLANTINFLGVEQAALVLPEKNIVLDHHQQPDMPVTGYSASNQHESTIYRYLQQHPESLVINQPADANPLGIEYELPLKAIFSPLFNADDSVIGMMSIHKPNKQEDFTNSDRNLIEVMANKANAIILQSFDPLTGLDNGRNIELQIDESLREVRKTDGRHAVALVDIARMSIVNDLGGLQEGDRLIKRVARIIQSTVRSFDSAAHTSGGRFTVLLKNCNLENALVVMQKVDQEVQKIELNLDGDRFDVSVSIGIAPVTSDILNLTSILSNVENALRAAKEVGRNQIQVFELDDDDLLRRKNLIKWVSRTQSALREGRFELYAQPIVPLNRREELPHYEILLRMLDQNQRPIPPGLFIPAAEKYFLMAKVDRWVIHRAISQLYAYQQQSGGVVCQISINLSGQSLVDRSLWTYIKQVMSDYPVDPQQVCFEVTESATIANLQDASRILEKVKNQGSLFSLDDFGSGLSSFSYLKQLPVDLIKIDGSFVHDIATSKVSKSMVSAIHQVARSMDLHTIAEYVENESILHELKAIGVDYAQGYHFAKPRPFDEILHNQPRFTTESTVDQAG